MGEKPEDGVVSFNRQAWDRVADAGDRYYRAMTSEQIQSARDGEWRIRITPTKAVPRDWLEPLDGKEILLLAGGGGQQSPILAALGAKVTVFDLSPRQLERDIEIAEREGFEIEAVSGDMADLSMFESERFDMVLNPCSVCYIPDVVPVWKEVARVLRHGGTFMTGVINPLYYIFDAAKLDRDEFVVRHKIPYSDADLGEEQSELLGDERPREFGHSLSDLIGAQLDAGMQLVGFYEDGWGGSDKLSTHISTFLATRSRKL
ncbi:Sarcosine/dimethylglycine N-methyltransferase [Mariniblastus fucicola]|uniref:Sarcosine/dimethylglycine N-methyltransferase n=1 Tax=Mariniblastus fucicola TaxID=980251 RepID=A0A5B9P7L5_9BACT|nr:Sarcosine/dimethylglycine N-methyltransferase [Mariniblastus fucicola]